LCDSLPFSCVIGNPITQKSYQDSSSLISDALQPQPGCGANGGRGRGLGGGVGWQELHSHLRSPFLPPFPHPLLQQQSNNKIQIQFI